MKRTYAKSLKEYEGPFEFDAECLYEAVKRINGRRKPTSIALDEGTIRKLKAVAKKMKIPYQVLMRVFIMDGLRRCGKTAA